MEPAAGPEVGPPVGTAVGPEVGPEGGPEVGPLVWPEVGPEVGPEGCPDVGLLVKRTPLSRATLVHDKATERDILADRQREIRKLILCRHPLK